MDKNENKNNISDEEFDRDIPTNDYRFLVQKLKDIKETIDLLYKSNLQNK